MKEYVCISGSPRRNGNTQFCAEIVCSKLRDSGRKVNFFNLIDYDIKRCAGCRKCMSLRKCAIKDDDFQPIMDAVLASDVIIVAAPVYWNSPPGIMKDFIDRTHGYYACTDVLRGKAAFIISVATASGFETHENIMESWLSCYGAQIQARLRLLAREKDDLRNSPSQIAQIKEFAEKMLPS